LHGEKIPHAEKVFSLSQSHAEWISKDKAGVPLELSLRVAVVENQHRFILHHHVMEKTTDDQESFIIFFARRKNKRSWHPRGFLFWAAKNLAYDHIQHRKVTENHLQRNDHS
jgi:RNA polymerase sigma factor (sigma-70 family)